jgi:hypothetical protein
MSRGHRRKQVPWCRCCPARRAGCRRASRRRWEARCCGRCGGRSAATLLATQMVVESEEREQREKGERAGRGRTPGEGSRPTHARERPAHMAVIDRFLAKQCGTSLRAASSGARRAGPPVGTRYCSSVASFHPGHPSCDPAAKQIQTTWPIHFLKTWSRLSMYLI